MLGAWCLVKKIEGLAQFLERLTGNVAPVSRFRGENHELELSRFGSGRLVKRACGLCMCLAGALTKVMSLDLLTFI